MSFDWQRQPLPREQAAEASELLHLEQTRGCEKRGCRRAAYLTKLKVELATKFTGYAGGPPSGLHSDDYQSRYACVLLPRFTVEIVSSSADFHTLRYTENK